MRDDDAMQRIEKDVDICQKSLIILYEGQRILNGLLEFREDFLTYMLDIQQWLSRFIDGGGFDRKDKGIHVAMGQTKANQINARLRVVSFSWGSPICFMISSNCFVRAFRIGRESSRRSASFSLK